MIGSAAMKPGMYVEKDAASFYTRLADIFRDTALSSVKERGRFFVALSGGGTPRRLHRMLAGPPYAECIPWDKTKIFWVDERCVPADDPASNYGNARADFLGKVPLPDESIYPMKGELPPDEGAASYELIMKRALEVKKGDLPSFDLILLGMGEDGHVASLFHGTVPGKDEGKWVLPVKGGNPELDRLTLTFPVLNTAKIVVFMISGKKKAQTVKRVFKDQTEQLPAQFVGPKNGQLIWVLDKEAASLL